MPGLASKIEKTGWILKAISSIAALVAPTWALIRLGELPDYLAGLAGIVLLAGTFAIIIAIIMLGGLIASLSPRKAAVILMACVASGAVLTVAYALTARELVVGNRHVDGAVVHQTDREIKPLNPTARTREIVDLHGNYRLALLSPDGQELTELMRARNLSATLLILATMVLAQLTLVASIVGGAWWLAERDAADASKDLGEEPPLGP